MDGLSSWLPSSQSLVLACDTQRPYIPVVVESIVQDGITRFCEEYVAQICILWLGRLQHSWISLHHVVSHQVALHTATERELVMLCCNSMSCCVSISQRWESNSTRYCIQQDTGQRAVMSSCENYAVGPSLPNHSSYHISPQHKCEMTRTPEGSCRRHSCKAARWQARGCSQVVPALQVHQVLGRGRVKPLCHVACQLSIVGFPATHSQRQPTFGSHPAGDSQSHEPAAAGSPS